MRLPGVCFFFFFSTYQLFKLKYSFEILKPINNPSSLNILSIDDCDEVGISVLN